MDDRAAHTCHPAAVKLNGKRVIFVFGNLELGGGERQGLLLACGLRGSYGCDVQIWGLSGAPGKLSELCDNYGIRWRGVGLCWHWGVRHGLANLMALARLVSLMRSEKPDLLLPYTFLPNLVCGLTWRFTGARLCVWNQRDAGFFLERGFWHRLAVHLTPRFVANSDQGRRALLEAYRLEGKPVAVIANGVALENARSGRKEWRTRLGVPEGAFLACMLANIHRFKDHRTLLRAWRRFLDTDARDARADAVLVLAGRQDEGCETLKDLMESLSLEGSVRFAGAVDDVAGLLEACDLYVHSAASEGLPNAVLEAMAAGLPVVGTDIEGVRRAVGPDGHRFLAPCGDAELLADRIAELFREGPLRSAQGLKMRRRVHEEFGVERMYKLTTDFIAKGWPDK